MRLFLISLVFIHTSIYATDWSFCHQQQVNSLPVPEDMQSPTGNGIELSADSVLASETDQTILKGEVVALRARDAMRAELLIYDKKTQVMRLDENVIYQTDGREIRASSAILPKNQNQGVFYNADVFIANRHAYIQADQFEQLDAEHALLHKLRYSTCEPNKNTWQLRASELLLDDGSGRGVAKQMQLWLKNIPIFYFPVFSFPIDERRQSGFLYPEFGRSDDRGFELAVPWYWNIAPQADATLKPRYMSRRGLQLNTEWRLLSRHTRNEFVSQNLNDHAINNPLLDKHRWLYRFAHTSTLPGDWQLNWLTHNVSDPGYFDDLGDNIEVGSLTFLDRSLSLSHTLADWHITISATDYEIIDSDLSIARKPYQLAPRVSVKREWLSQIGGLDYEFSSIITEFEHKSRLTGQRWITRSRFSRPTGAAGWFVNPALSVYHGQYWLDASVNNNSDQDLSHTVPTFSLDNGLIFERYTRQYLQTLEPRVYYLYTPFKAQSQVPVFDSGLVDFSFAQLFSENRFTGDDRVSDANQFTLALSSRLLDPDSGDEVLRLSLGQVFYQDAREVTLPGKNIDDNEESDIVAGLGWRIARYWRLLGDIEWNPDIENTSQGVFNLQYRRDNKHILNFSHRYRRDDIEQIDLNGRWSLSNRWRLVAKYQYDLPARQDIDTFAGLEYENCCIALRLIGRRYLNDEEVDSSIYFQLSLKGLSRLGDKKAGSIVSRGIHGYMDEF